MRALCHRAPVERRYYSGSCSLAFLVSCALSALVVLLPLLLAHGSRDFGVRVNTYREQPAVALMYQCVCVLEGERVDAATAVRVPFVLVHTTLSPRINRLVGADSRAALFKHYARDTTGDKLSDSLHVDVDMPLLANETVHRVTTIVLLNYTLQSYAKLTMDALAMYTHDSAMPGRSLIVDGDLELHLRRPLVITDTLQAPYATAPLLNMSRIQSPQDFQLETIVTKYREREYSAHFQPRYPVWTTDSSANAQSNVQRAFRVRMTIRIPSVDVLYHPLWSEVLKKAWIQYYCILVAISAVAMHIREYLFKGKLLASVSAVNDSQLRRAISTSKSH